MRLISIKFKNNTTYYFQVLFLLLFQEYTTRTITLLNILDTIIKKFYFFTIFKTHIYIVFQKKHFPIFLNLLQNSLK